MIGSGDGDGWVWCARGHKHWGRFGAAGLLICDGARAILQHRAPWTHEGGTWGLPGGARDSHEDATTTALREAQEEAAIAGSSIDPVASWVDDHGGWSYTTVLARPNQPLHPHAANSESTEITWWNRGDVDSLPLHHGFAATWPHLRDAPRRLTIVVDVRAHPSFTRLVKAGETADDLDALIRAGVPLDALPGAIDGGQTSRLLPRVVLVESGAPGKSPNDATLGAADWWRRAREVVLDAGAPANAIARVAGGVTNEGQLLVVTADLEVAYLLPRTTIVDPGWLLAGLAHHRTATRLPTASSQSDS